MSAVQKHPARAAVRLAALTLGLITVTMTPTSAQKTAQPPVANRPSMQIMSPIRYDIANSLIKFLFEGSFPELPKEPNSPKDTPRSR